MNERGQRLFVLVLTAALTGCDTAGPFEFGNPEPLVVRVTGREFQWYFTYPGVDGEFGTNDDIDSAHDLRIPKGYDVKLDVTSEDYLYAFRAPELELREVAVPGMSFSINFKPDRTGHFELEVDPICGFDFLHANRLMGHVVVADTIDDADETRWPR